MRTFNLLFISIVLALCLFACKKDNSSAPGSNNPLIAGNWNLQRQTSTEYVDGVRSPDMIFNSSHIDTAYLHLDNDGKYLSVNKVIVSTTPLVMEADSSSGIYTYSYSSNKFTLSAGFVLSLYPLIGAFPGGTAPIAYVQPISDSVQVTQLTAKLLTLHFAIVDDYHYTTGGFTTYRTVSDVYFTR